MKTNLWHELLNLFYPNVCLVCAESLLKNEKQLCMNCLHEMPKTNYHLQKDNPIEKRFWGKANVHRGTSFFYFQKGSPFQKLLHALKYKGNKEIGELLGKYAAVDLLDAEDFCSIDLIIPVPLHPKKYASRGYNQSEWIGKGLSELLDKPMDIKILTRTKENTTQTKKTVYERYENTEGIFDVASTEDLEGLHILLVDDVLTTGSTLESCIKALSIIPKVKISVFTLAIA